MNKDKCTWGRGWGTDSEDSVHDFGCKALCECRVDFGSKGGVGDVDECSAVKADRLLEAV